MTNQQLSDYIRQQLQQGKNKEEIKSELLEAGWQEKDINQTIGMSASAQLPRPPSTHSFVSTGQQQLNPKAVWLFFFRWVFIFLFIAAWLGFGSIVALSDTVTGALGIGLLVFFSVLVFSFIWAKLTYHFYRYELTEEGFRKEVGVIFKKYVTIPYDRIQNIDIYRGILTRILGLSDLNIQTAGMSAPIGRFGGGGAEGRLLGLSQEKAEQLRKELIHRANQNKNQGL